MPEDVVNALKLKIMRKKRLMKNKDLIKNYYDQLAELQRQYWFEYMEN